jgi:hypothetical protein
MVKKTIKFYLILFMCTLGIALSHAPVLAMTPIDTYPMADWLLISGANKGQDAKACLVARDFDAGVMLAVTQKAGGSISLGFNFRKDVLTLNKTHYIALSMDTGYNKLYQLNMSSKREMILDLNPSQPNENPLVGAREIYMNIQGLHSYKFNIPDMNQGLDKLNSCSASLPAQVPSMPPSTMSEASEIVPNDPPPVSSGLTPNSFHNVLDNLTSQKKASLTTAPHVKIPVSPTLQRQKIEATPVLENPTHPKPEPVTATPPSPPAVTVASSPAAPSQRQKIEATPVLDEPVKKEPTPIDTSSDEFAYTPPAFFTPEASQTVIGEPAKDDVVETAAAVKLPVPDSIEEMSQKMQDIKEGNLPPIPEPASVTEPAQPPEEENLASEEEVIKYDPLPNDGEQNEEFPDEGVAEADEDSVLTPPAPSPKEETAASNVELDPELVESLVQKIKLLEIEKESLRDRLHEYEIDNKILKEITPR